MTALKVHVWRAAVWASGNDPTPWYWEIAPPRPEVSDPIYMIPDENVVARGLATSREAATALGLAALDTLTARP